LIGSMRNTKPVDFSTISTECFFSNAVSPTTTNSDDDAKKTLTRSIAQQG